MKVVFMGSPSFSIHTLESLFKSNHEVVAVFTKPPKPKGRGKNLAKTKIHEFAEQNNVPVFTPKTLRNEDIIQQIRSLNPDFILVAAYGLIIPNEVIEIPKYDIINIHPSLLPRWRGAAPIQHTIMSGDKEAGVCVMRIIEELDAGDIYAVEKIPLEEDISFESLTNKLFRIGSKLVIELLDKFADGKIITPTPQSENGIKYADKPEKYIIDFNEGADSIKRKILALSPDPGVFCTIKNTMIKILEAKSSKMDTKHGEPGEIIDDNSMSIACKQGTLHPKIVQKPSKKPTKIEDFIRGFRN